MPIALGHGHAFLTFAIVFFYQKVIFSRVLQITFAGFFLEILIVYATLVHVNTCSYKEGT